MRLDIETRELIKEYKKYCGIKLQRAIIAGTIYKRYKSKIIINGILKTAYYKSIEEARNHYKEELIKQLIQPIPNMDSYGSHI